MNHPRGSHLTTLEFPRYIRTMNRFCATSFEPTHGGIRGGGVFGLIVCLALLPTAAGAIPKTARPARIHPLKAPHGWKVGRWQKGWHHGRYGWWWRTRHRWYFYLTPIRPYPPYYGSGPIPLPGAPLAGTPFLMEPLPPTQLRWYCLSPPGFYPFVTSCMGGWMAVQGPPP